jgi:[NiFe] hydrogenase assembly HybE family chaperone
MSTLSTATDRVAALEGAFRHIQATRMAGVPVLHAGVKVQAVGFEPSAAQEAGVLCGVLVTPWFMSLLRLPLQPLAGAHPPWLGLGCKAMRQIGDHGLEFIGAHERDLGVFETSSLFSPMFEFADHAAALATATALLQQLRAPAAAPVPVPSRRGFLFGRSSSAGAAP